MQALLKWVVGYMLFSVGFMESDFIISFVGLGRGVWLLAKEIEDCETALTPRVSAARIATKL